MMSLPPLARTGRLVLPVVLAFLAVVLCGCQWARWLRLLSLKKQLGQVERYVRIEDQGGLTLKFLKPVVYADDLSLLIADETSRATNRNRVEWLWTYEKQSAEIAGDAEPGKSDLSFTIGFDDSKFSELRFDERFLGLMPKPLIIGLLRSVGQAEVNMKRGTVSMKWVGPGPNQQVRLPTKTQVTKLLGAPFLITAETNGTHTFLYKYYQKLARQSAPCERLAWAKFSFKDGSDEIDSSEGVIGNVGWRMVRVPGQPEPQVTFSLEPLTVEPVAVRLPPQIASEYVGQYKKPEPGGTVFNVGMDGDIFVFSWRNENENSGGWCAALPEQTNILFAVPGGLPRATFYHNHSGTVTGLVAQLQGVDTLLIKSSGRLPEPPRAAECDPAILVACAGRYKASWGGSVRISHKDAQLFWQNDGVRALLPLYPSSETNFFFKAVDSPLTFVKNERGEVTKFILHYYGRHSEAVKEK